MASFNSGSVSAAQYSQQTAAQDASSQVRLIAGPGSGKSRTILMRLRYLVSQGFPPNSIYVISFTRASAVDLRTRVTNEFNGAGLALVGAQIAANVTTMHSLALKLLANANLLAGMYPASPVVLDQWQQENIFDEEFSATANVTAKRAREVRAAYDAHWQTLAALNILGGGTPPTQTEQTRSLPTIQRQRAFTHAFCQERSYGHASSKLRREVSLQVTFQVLSILLLMSTRT